MKRFTLTDRFMAMVHLGIFAKAIRRAAAADTQPDDMAMPTVRNGELALADSAWDAELSWDEWLKNLPPVDGWPSTATWLARHGGEAVGQ
ncbi:hypothetical protein ACWCW7_34505 [Nocardia tengchongensis]